LKYELIDAATAPPKPATAQNKRQMTVQTIVMELVPGKAARVQLEGNETAKGVKASITRMARRLGKSVNVWDAQGAVYAEVAEDRPRRRRGRRPKNATD
jgi:hypothetical protein